MTISSSARIHPLALVEEGAVIGDNVSIGPFCHVGPKVVLGEGTELITHAVVTGRTTVGTLIGVLERMTALISNDSGAMHVAAALDRPVVAIFGPTDELRTRPLGDHTVLTAPAFCRPCLLRDCPIDHRCMKRITAASAPASCPGSVIA